MPPIRRIGCIYSVSRFDWHDVEDVESGNITAIVGLTGMTLHSPLGLGFRI